MTYIFLKQTQIAFEKTYFADFVISSPSKKVWKVVGASK